MHHLQYLVEQYGYLALLIGTFFEGETILVIAGFLAHRGYLQLPWVALVAFAGSYAGDQMFFYLGRRYGPALVAKRRRLRARTRKVLRLLHRHHLPVALGFRFLYGIRTVTPFAIGMSGLSPWRFLLLNGIGAMVWAWCVGALGYAFGSVAESLMGHIKRYELWFAVGIAAAGALLWLVTWLRNRKEQE